MIASDATFPWPLEILLVLAFALIFAALFLAIFGPALCRWADRRRRKGYLG